ncbi:MULTISPECIES: SDR family NAD(P)-dependent oxidoreductase [Streptomyces]|uniref:SDR family NAD(P)-dependent oxidoreductase n=1 Tax=Streptomyces TaxID=1883 RepID=UPI0016790E23|nr:MULTISPECIES: SDR family oxidoreductase [Streptomyces]MBK3525538.1 SDR family oxidoreductase [Streptomyces sp. MBT70]GGR92620.1 short-chain dehydrogenase [Streptomyces eurythermus]
MEESAVVIIGASSGFGAALAEDLAAAGRTVVAGARSARESGGGVLYRQVDVADERSVADFFGYAASVSPAPYGLVYSAGDASAVGYGWEVGPDELARVFDATFFGFVRCLRHAVPAMREAGRGSVLALGSHSARFPVEMLGAYASAKAALEHYVRTLAKELTGTGVRANALGIVAETALSRDFLDRKASALGRQEPYPALPQVRDNLPLARFLLSEESRHVSGQVVDAFPPAW